VSSEPVASPSSLSVPHVPSPPAVFSCSISRGAGRVSLEIIGEIDRTSAGQFRNQLLTLAKEHPVGIAIDLEHVELPDEAGVAVLVEVWRFARGHGIELAVLAPTPAITQAFDVAPSGRLLTLRG
jgi:anti-anti-sigma factor